MATDGFVEGLGELQADLARQEAAGPLRFGEQATLFDAAPGRGRGRDRGEAPAPASPAPVPARPAPVHPPANPFADLTAAETAALIRAGRATAEEVTAAALDSIEALQPTLNAFALVLREQALAQARVLDAHQRAGGVLGPLHGVPLALKDNVDTAGLPTTAGARIYRDRVPAADAPVTRRLAAAGAVLVGKTNMHELATGMGHPDWGDPHNPWDLARACAGSSSGSGCAVAARLVPVAIGSDTGGSIRLPAHACGITGLKATYGLVPRTGVVPLSWSLDHVGPMTRTAEDAALVLAAMAGYDAGDPSSLHEPAGDLVGGLGLPVRGTVVGVPAAPAGVRIGREQAAATQAAARVLEELGCHVVEVDVPDMGDAWSPAIALMAGDLAEIVREELATRPEDLGPWVLPFIRIGEALPARDYVRAQRLRERYRAEVARAMRTVDVILTPTVPYEAWPLGAAEVEVDGVTVPYVPSVGTYTPAWNLTGMPAVSIPCGFTQAGLPLGLQLAARPLEDALLLRVAHAYQQATGWHTRRPPVCA